MTPRDPNAPQVVSRVRGKMAEQARRLTGEEVEFSDAEILHLLHIRSVGYGEMSITIARGRPGVATVTHARVDYSKEVVFDGPGE